MHLSIDVGKLAQRMYWTHRHAEGYVDGRIYKLHGKEMPKDIQFGTDEYSKGFRLGYCKQPDLNLDKNDQTG